MRLAPAGSNADDLAQETFLTAWAKAASFSGDGQYKGWLLRIAWTTFLMDARTRRRRIPQWKGAADAPLPEQAAPDDAEEALVVADAMSRLKVGDRAAVTLCLVLGYSHSEAARILVAPLGSVKSRVARGTKQLMALLGETDDE